MEEQSKKKQRKKRLVIGVVAVLLLSGYLYWQDNDLMQTEYTCNSPDVPAEFDGYRIVQVSDLHNKWCGKDQKRLIEAIREEQPDIIVLTGDIMDGNHPKVEPAARFCELAVKIAPVYFVPGNHEAMVKTEYRRALYDRMHACGVIFMIDRSVELTREEAAITLTGLESIRKADYFALKQISDAQTDFVVLLEHNPTDAKAFLQSDADLTLTGHTHGGQFRLPLIGGLYAPDQGILPEYDGGAFYDAGHMLIINRGVGNSGFPFRVGNRPEIVTVTLHRMEGGETT